MNRAEIFSMTKREAAVLEIYTGTVMLEEDDRKYTQQYIEKLLGRSFSYVELLNEATDCNHPHSTAYV